MANRGEDIINAIDADHRPSISHGPVGTWQVECTCGFQSRGHASKQHAGKGFAQHYEEIMRSSREVLLIVRVRVPKHWTDAVVRREIVQCLSVKSVGVVGGFKVI